MRMTSRNGSRLMYQPGQAAPGKAAALRSDRTEAAVPTRAPRLVSARPFFVASVAGASGWQSLGDARRLQIGLAAHDGGDAGGVVAAGIGVVGQAGGHEQRAEIGVAQAERTIVMRVAHDHLGGIAGVVHDDFLRGDEDVDGMAIGGDVERPVGRELQQVQAGQVAGGVVEEHVLAAGIRRH